MSENCGKEEGELSEDEDTAGQLNDTKTVAVPTPPRPEVTGRTFNFRRKRTHSRDRGTNSWRTKAQKLPFEVDLATYAASRSNSVPAAEYRKNRVQSGSARQYNSTTSHRSASRNRHLQSQCLPKTHTEYAAVLRAKQTSLNESSRVSGRAKGAVEIITIDESDVDDEAVILSAMRIGQEDEDLDELKLRRDALDSAVKYSGVRRSVNLTRNTSNDCERSSRVDPTVDKSLFQSDHSCVSELASHSLPESCTYSYVASNSGPHTVTTVATVPAAALSAKDNYDELDMDLDSNSDSLGDPNVLKCGTEMPGTSDTICHFTDDAHALLQASVGLSPVSSVEAADETNAQPSVEISDQNMNGQCTADYAFDATAEHVLQSSTTCTEKQLENPAASSPEEFALSTLVDPQQSQSETEILHLVESPLEILHNRKNESVDEISTLLLRAEVLKSLKGARKPVAKTLQSSQKDAKTDKLKLVTTNVTPVHLPKHGPVVISLHEESSDAEDANKPCATTSQKSSSNGGIGINEQLSAFLREMRRATDTPQQHPSILSLQDAEYVPDNAGTVAVLGVSQVENAAGGASELQQSKVTSGTNIVDKCTSGKLAIIKQVRDSGQAADGPKGTVVIVSEVKHRVLQEKSILQKRKVALCRSQLRLKRKQEHLQTAEKRVEKLQEQLAAAERIVSSTQKQVRLLEGATSSLQCSVDQCQTKLETLEVQLGIVEGKLSSVKFETGRVSSSHHHPPIAMEKTSAVEMHKVGVMHKQKRRKSLVSTEIAADIADATVRRKELVERKDPEERTEKSCDIDHMDVKENVMSHPVKLEAQPVDNASGIAETVVDQKVTNLAATSDLNRIVPAALKLPTGKKLKLLEEQYGNTLQKHATLSSVNCSPLLTADPLLSFPQIIKAASLAGTAYVVPQVPLPVLQEGTAFSEYNSPLRCFRTYRFSHLNKSSCLTSHTYSNKLDCREPLCRFELMGRCLDDSCSLQHQSDYTLDATEKLIDIASYYPSLAGISSKTPASEQEQLLRSYVAKVVKEMDTSSSNLDQCHALFDRIVTATDVADHSVNNVPRSWKLGCRKRTDATGNDGVPSTTLNISNVKTQVPEVTGESLLHATEDVRYWTASQSSQQLSDLEAAVVATPHEDDVWVKLARAKMADMKYRVGDDDYVDHGLDILARAVEANPSSCSLWKHYLELYMQRSDARQHLPSLYEQVVQFASSYEFFWHYLQLPLSYEEKMDICRRIRQYLCSPMCQHDSAARSRYLVEVVHYQASLSNVSGRFKAALQVIQAIVQSKASVIWLTLTPADRVLMWMSFIHLYECRQLPTSLFDPKDSNPGHIVNRQPFVIPFAAGVRTRVSHKTLLQLFESAFSACSKGISADVESSSEYELWLAALYRSRILLELSCNGWHAAKQLCQQTAQQVPHLVNIWILLLQLVIAAVRDAQIDVGLVDIPPPETVKQALSFHPHSVSLHLTAVSALMSCGQTDAALTFAELCPISLFEVDEADSASGDPNLLYQWLLGQPLPISFKTPMLRSSVSRKYLDDQQANLWIGYCLLLDLQGAHQQAVEAYQVALHALSRTEDIRRVWLALLRRHRSVVLDELPWMYGGSRQRHSVPKQQQWSEFISAIDEALTALPVKSSLPNAVSANQSQTWHDYSCHNEVIKLYVSAVPDPHKVQEIFEKYLLAMPDNVELALTALQFCFEQDLHQLCYGLCLSALHCCPSSASLWHVFLRLTRHKASPDFVRSLYAKSTAMLPYHASLWKAYIVFEILNGSSEQDVSALIDRCLRLQINVSSVVDGLTVSNVPVLK